MTKKAQPIRDKVTGKEYRSKAAAGKDLARIVGGDRRNNYVWYQVHRKHPDRFETKDSAGNWIPHPYSDYYTEEWKAKRRNESLSATKPANGATTRVTTVQIDEKKLEEVRQVLGTRNLRATVDGAFDEVLARAAREQSIEQLQKMDGLDLGRPEVMARAWR